MTETIVPNTGNLSVTSLEPTKTRSSETITSSANTAAGSTSPVITSVRIDLTPTAPEGSVRPEPVSPIATRRLYPQLFDLNEPAGKAVTAVERALKDARDALDAYDEGDVEGALSRVTLVGARCAKAHEYTSFNESFGAVAAFVRRAAILAGANEISRDSLNVLVQAIAKIINNPMLSLDDAAAVVQMLMDNGWHGEHQAVDEFITVLVEAESLQVNTSA